MTELNLLVVTGDPVDREATIRSLRRAKIANHITTAADGLAALDLLRGTNGCDAIPTPRLVILDLHLPRMTGCEFLDELRSDDDLAETTVFVLTTYADPSLAELDCRQNVAGSIMKERVGADFVRLVELGETFWRVVDVPGKIER